MSTPSKQIKTESTTEVKDVPVGQHAVTMMQTPSDRPNWHGPIQSTEKTTVVKNTDVLPSTTTAAPISHTAARPVANPPIAANIPAHAEPPFVGTRAAMPVNTTATPAHYVGTRAAAPATTDVSHQPFVGTRAAAPTSGISTTAAGCPALATAPLHTNVAPTATSSATPVVTQQRQTVVKEKELVGDERMDTRVTVESATEKTPAWYQPTTKVVEKTSGVPAVPGVATTSHGIEQRPLAGTSAAIPAAHNEKALKEQNKAAEEVAKQRTAVAEAEAKAAKDVSKAHAKANEKIVAAERKAGDAALKSNTADRF